VIKQPLILLNQTANLSKGALKMMSPFPIGLWKTTRFFDSLINWVDSLINSLIKQKSRLDVPKICPKLLSWDILLKKCINITNIFIQILFLRSVIMKIIIGSKNPAKIMAVKNSFQLVEAEFVTLDIPSNVNEQPFTDEETIQGAINRALGALKQGKGDIGIGLEGGVQETSHGLLICNWGALATNGMEPIIAGGARFILPLEVATRLKAGEELGPVMDDYANKQNVSKQEGAVGIFTNGLINRVDMFTHLTKLLFGQYSYQKRQLKE
jgi:inosine/xanthosine triphosphatase